MKAYLLPVTVILSRPTLKPTGFSLHTPLGTTVSCGGDGFIFKHTSFGLRRTYQITIGAIVVGRDITSASPTTQ